jgi:hypothetical protein
MHDRPRYLALFGLAATAASAAASGTVNIARIIALLVAAIDLGAIKLLSAPYAGWGYRRSGLTPPADRGRGSASADLLGPGRWEADPGNPALWFRLGVSPAKEGLNKGLGQG